MRMNGRKNAKKVMTLWLLTGLLAGGLTGCGGGYRDNATGTAAVNQDSAYESAVYDDVGDNAAYEEIEYDGGEIYGLADQDIGQTTNKSTAGQSSSRTGQNSDADVSMSHNKIIKRYSFAYETEEFDKAYAYLKEQIRQYQGYISESEIEGTGSRRLMLTARIPADVSDDFTGSLGEVGTLLEQSESAEDITLQYADTESRITSLKTEQQRLNELLKEADSLETVIELEDRLTDVRYELESYQSQKNLYDDLVAYSTVNISVNEVAYTVPVDDRTVLSRIRTGLESSLRDVKMDLENFIVGLIISLPYLIIWAVVLFVIFRIGRRIHRKRKLRRQRKQQIKQEEQEHSTAGPEKKKDEEQK